MWLEIEKEGFQVQGEGKSKGRGESRSDLEVRDSVLHRFCQKG